MTGSGTRAQPARPLGESPGKRPGKMSERARLARPPALKSLGRSGNPPPRRLAEPGLDQVVNDTAHAVRPTRTGGPARTGRRRGRPGSKLSLAGLQASDPLGP